jgi:hypothetical protein
MLARYWMQPTSRFFTDIVFQIRGGKLDLNPSYQRGDVWTIDQRRNLIKSLLIGIPVASIVFNRRGGNTGWTRNEGESKYWSACIDGKQRLTTMFMWEEGQFAIPVEWLRSEWLADPTLTPEQYVYYHGLTEAGQRITNNMFLVSVAEAELPSMALEAEVYRLLNTTGTIQNRADLARAAEVERGDS